MMKTILVILISILTSVKIYPQVTEEWVKRYNGPENSGDKAYSIAADASGNIYVTGYSINDGFTDCITVKYNSSGAEQWAKRYNGSGNGIDEGKDVAVDASGNIYVCGFSSGLGTAEDYLLIKYNSAGDELWVRRYNDTLNLIDRASSLAIDPSGNIYVTGKGGTASGGDFVTVKYSPNGDRLWVRSYNGPALTNDETTSIAIDASENIYVTGISVGSGGAQNDFATVKYDQSGNQQWVKRYNGSANGIDEARSICFHDGFIYVNGFSNETGTSYDHTLIKYNTVGDELWVRKFNSSGNAIDEGRYVTTDASGNIFVTGYSNISGTNYDLTTIKYNSSGVLQWSKQYDGPGNAMDEGLSAVTDASGNVYVTGRSDGSSTGLDYVAIKYDAAGNEKWSKRYNGPGSGEDVSSSIVLDASGNVFLTGGSNGSGTSSDFATIKYSQSVGINQISNETPGNYSLSQNYPNPFNPSTNIRFNVSQRSFVSVKIFDMTGKEIDELAGNIFDAGTYESNWNAEDLAGGIYFCRMTANDFVSTMKMILIK